MARWIHIHGAERLLDPGSGVDQRGEVWVRDGLIHSLVAVGESPVGGPAPNDQVEHLDARGALITPMFIDLHVHLREPGGEQSETLASGAAAALAGGYATVYAMPNTSPTCDVPAQAERTRRSAEHLLVEVVPVSALSQGLRGRELVDLEAMAAAGAGAFSDDGAWLENEALAKEAFSWAARNDVLIAQHCEDFAVTGAGVLHSCSCVTAAGMPGIPREAEDRAVERDLHLAARMGTRLHVCHVSTQGAVQALRRARDRGEPGSGEVTPHHLLLTAADALRGGADFKMKPPLRESSDVDALVDALQDGTLGAVATDHAPHAPALKDRGLLGAPFGAIGLETAFAALYTGLVEPGRLSLSRLVESLTSGPALIARRVPPQLRVGSQARLNLLDLHTPWQVDRAQLRSASRNCPFHGWTLRGRPVASLLGGQIEWHGAEQPST